MAKPPTAAIASTPAPTPEPIYAALFESSVFARLSVPVVVPKSEVGSDDKELLISVDLISLEDFEDEPFSWTLLTATADGPLS